jgi:hypothetical protein
MTLLDTDAADFTEHHGKNHLKKAALFRIVREIRVQKSVRIQYRGFAHIIFA